MHLQLVFLLMCASAQLCASSHCKLEKDGTHCKFYGKCAVDNCALCDTKNTKCDNQTVDKEGPYCQCPYPYVPVKQDWHPYPSIMKTYKTVCSRTYTYTRLQTALMCGGACIFLYAGIHAFYIAVVSGMCSWEHRGCTKHEYSALLAGISALCCFGDTLGLIVFVITTKLDPSMVFADGGCDINSDKYIRSSSKDIVKTSYYLFLMFPVFFMAAFVLLTMSISDMVNHGEDAACRRRWLKRFFWAFLILCILSIVIYGYVNATAGGHLLELLAVLLAAILGSTMCLVVVSSTVLIVIAHRRMRKIIHEHSTSTTKPSLVAKLGDLSVAIRRYFYLMPIIVVAWTICAWACIIYKINRTESDYHRNYHVYQYDENWTSLVILMHVLLAPMWVLFACFLEGKPVPTFPACLCRRGQQPGLQFTAALGNALALLKKYGLDNQHQEDFPVEAAMESLLSTSPLMVAAAPDMDLMSCVDYFVDRCTDDEGKLAKRFLEMPIGRLLREGCSQHVVVKEDIPQLREKADRCLQWAHDPARQAIANMSNDEAAAIQLYTQHCCLYPMLNDALRDHTHPENLNAFKPYLKLLLTALNKLPLVRATVYRGMKADLHETYNELPGRVIRWWAFSSTTPRQTQAEAFMGSTGDRTLFTIDAIGVDISAFSAFPGEKEVLLLPGTCLMVDSGFEVEDRYYEFEASVWEATQQQRHTHDQQRQQKQHDEPHHEAKSDGIQAAGIAVGVSGPRFQSTDLPHPGWTTIVSTQSSQPPLPPTSQSLSNSVMSPLLSQV